ncbi:MAG: hypothetical protein VB088_06095 [Sphaerochaeta sp.]|jgi:hypothetical protein|nr:hypothetical protein [Sphaerochaeta sp.]MDX9824985.1 hypothetical protein [Sphaerochaeta sp.]MEA4864957.1 hypothetical protein [Sphaerochaeta sp.]
MYSFDAVIQKVPDQDGAYVVVPFDIRRGSARIFAKASGHQRINFRG